MRMDIRHTRSREVLFTHAARPARNFAHAAGIMFNEACRARAEDHHRIDRPWLPPAGTGLLVSGEQLHTRRVGTCSAGLFLVPHERIT